MIGFVSGITFILLLMLLRTGFQIQPVIEAFVDYACVMITIGAIGKILIFSNLARKEGVPTLEEAAQGLV